jgi:hypothetical protein
MYNLLISLKGPEDSHTTEEMSARSDLFGGPNHGPCFDRGCEVASVAAQTVVEEDGLEVVEIRQGSVVAAKLEEVPFIGKSFNFCGVWPCSNCQRRNTLLLESQVYLCKSFISNCNPISLHPYTTSIMMQTL